LNTYNAGRGWKNEEIVRQIKLTRSQPGAIGHIHWDMKKGLMLNPAIQQSLLQDVYGEPALIPALPWLSDRQPEKPALTAKASGSGATASWKSAEKDKICWWVLQLRTGTDWTTEILPANRTERKWKNTQPEAIALRAVDRVGQTSSASVLKLQLP
jgi:hypothetical protein